MKTAVAITLITLLSLAAFANDGTYLTRGGVIYPVKETKISMEKEILSFTCKNRIARVDIQFEFNNPEAVERKMLVGFQAPSAGGDVDDEIGTKTGISDFTIIQDGKILPYKLMVTECEDCELKETKELHFSYENWGVYVYLFEVSFKPGKNSLNHSYGFPASSNVFFNQTYNYILKTGSKWAGGSIKDLTVHIDMGDNAYFYVNDIFGSKANWSVIGSGKVTGKSFDYGDSITSRMIRVLSGRLQISVKNFRPVRNIEFGIISDLSFINFVTDRDSLENGSVVVWDHTPWELTNYSKRSLKLFRNTIYAQYGYAFNTKELQDYFSQFAWYMPDPNLTMEQIPLTEKEKLFIEEIIKREKE